MIGVNRLYAGWLTVPVSSDQGWPAQQLKPSSTSETMWAAESCSSLTERRDTQTFHSYSRRKSRVTSKYLTPRTYHLWWLMQLLQLHNRNKRGISLFPQLITGHHMRTWCPSYSPLFIVNVDVYVAPLSLKR